MKIKQKEVIQFQEEILTWFDKNKRDLPWRHSRDPYKILLSEIMLQQTQVSRVIPKYEAWLRVLPTIQDLAKADTTTVLRLWSGLGYNRRALYLQRLARMIVADFNGSFPQDEKILRTLPGIGEYTARALLCFAFDKQVAVVDTNVRKVILIHFPKFQISNTKLQINTKEIQSIADILLPAGKSYEWNQALMDYASAMLKKEKIPLIKQTPFKDSNRYYRGQIIKLLIARQSVTVEELVQLLKKDATFIDGIAKSLIKEGLIKIKKNKYMLP